jgi:hypothetical protein
MAVAQDCGIGERWRRRNKRIELASGIRRSYAGGVTSPRISVALAVVGAFVAGIWVGAFISSPETPRTLPGSASPPSTASSLPSSGDSLHPENSAARFDSSSDSHATAEKFWTTLTIGDDRERQAAWLAVLPKLSADNALEVRELFRKMDKQGRWFIPEWNAFWLRWGEVDGAAALEHVKTINMKDYEPALAERVLKGWATKDSAGARSWLQANTASPWYDGALRGYLDGLARIDLDGATRDAVTLGKGRDMNRIAEVLTEQALQQRQLGGMLEWWRALPDDTSEGSARRKAISHVYQRLQIANDARTSEWLAELAGTPYRPEVLIGNHGEKIAGRDPAGALNWIASLPPTPNDGYFTGLTQTIHAIAKRDPAFVENWLNRLPPSPLRDQGVVGYGIYLDQNSQPDAAERWFYQVRDKLINTLGRPPLQPSAQPAR